MNIIIAIARLTHRIRINKFILLQVIGSQIILLSSLWVFGLDCFMNIYWRSIFTEWMPCDRNQTMLKIFDRHRNV